jgi:hypothetical protein
MVIMVLCSIFQGFQDPPGRVLRLATGKEKHTKENRARFIFDSMRFFSHLTAWAITPATSRP